MTVLLPGWLIVVPYLYREFGRELGEFFRALGHFAGIRHPRYIAASLFLSRTAQGVLGSCDPHPMHPAPNKLRATLRLPRVSGQARSSGVQMVVLCGHDLPESSLPLAESERLRCGESSSRKKVKTFNGRCRNMDCIWASLPGDRAWNDEQSCYFSIL
jgi:hypothetical protein